MKLSIIIGTTRDGESVVIGKPGKSADIKKSFKAIKDGVIGSAKNKVKLSQIDIYGISRSDSIKSRRFKA